MNLTPKNSCTCLSDHESDVLTWLTSELDCKYPTGEPQVAEECFFYEPYSIG